MNFQIYKDYLYQNLSDILSKEIPEFKSVFENKDGIYPILGEFARFIISNRTNKEIIHKSFHFINESLDKGGHETEDVISCQIFEQLYEADEMYEIAKSLLKGKALRLFTNNKTTLTREYLVNMLLLIV